MKGRILAAVAGALSAVVLLTAVGMAVIYAWLALGWQWIVAGALVLLIATLAWIRYRRRDS